MGIALKLDQLHYKARQNKWLWRLSIFFRIGLAWGFLPSGLVKIFGERFTSLSGNHPLGHYLDALYVTGYYYTFIGVVQVLAAILLLIPGTVTLGAFIYLPVILNICILSLSVRFDGSLVSSPLMVLACLYLIYWNYHKWKFILPLKHSGQQEMPSRKEMSNKFPVAFFSGVFAVTAIVVLTALFAYELKPRNTIGDCQGQCAGSRDPEACLDFCDCIHQQGQPLKQCLDAYDKSSGN